MNNIDYKLLDYLTFLKNHLKKQINDNKKDCYVLGVSTGIDSVLSLRILLDVLEPKNIRAYFIDIESNIDKQYLNLVQNYFKEFNLEIKEINLFNSYSTIVDDFKINNHIATGNIKSKLRSMYLYSKAFEYNGLVLNTTNYDEYILGYYTKFGDSNGDVYLLNGLLKTHIKSLANYYKIPTEIIQRNPTSGLSNNCDEEDFGFSYSELDQILLKKNKNIELEQKIQQRIINNKHKQITLKNSLLKQFKKYKY